MKTPLLALAFTLASFTAGAIAFGPEKAATATSQDLRLPERAKAFADKIGLGVHRAGQMLSIQAMADEPSFQEPPFDLEKLLRIDDADYSVSVDEEAVGNVLSHATVRKLGYGRTEFINIVTTSAGTFSSDGVRSSHIQYPGIETLPISVEVPVRLVVGKKHSYFTMPLGMGKSSVVFFGEMNGGGTYFSTKDTFCFADKGYAGCK